MKSKNKKLMIVVASLLVVIGVSFAYFAASNFFGGSGSSVSATTATLQGSELRVEGTLEFNDLDIYPGHESVSSIKVTATGDNELIPYNVIWEGTNTLNTPLNYTIYKTSSEIDVSASCEKQKGVIDGAMMYYEECKISNIDSLGTQVSSGTINTNETKVTLISDEFITSTSTGEEIYYYVILEYPNLEEAQNSDIGGTFTGKVTVELSDAEPDITIIETYLEEDGNYVQSEDIPTTGYKLNLEKSSCSNSTTLGWDSENNRVYVENLNQSGTECTLYYDEYNPNVAKEYILSKYDTVLTRNDFSLTVTNTTTGTIYKSLDESQYDNGGEVYYFAGNPTDNWVNFGGYYWRIIRINGDGTIRLIYNGTSTVTTGGGTLINGGEEQSFSSSDNRSEYVGLKYTTGEQYGQETDSLILDTLQSWYSTSGLSATQYSQHIDSNVGFCSDRNMANGYSWSSQPSTAIFYAVYDRLVSSKNPSLSCTSSDIIEEPVGLITADEVAFSGGVWNINNTSYYLYNKQNYWTMSPYYFGVGSSANFTIDSNGAPKAYSTNYYTRSVRPVINLCADVQLTGSGTSTDPYRIA